MTSSPPSNDPSNDSPTRPPRRTRLAGLVGITWRHALVGVAGIALGVALACSTRKEGSDSTKVAFDSGSARPDTYPVMINREMPFRYPPALYAEKVQGNVVLRLFVDTAGAVVNDSTRVVESSKVPMLDSAALSGSRDLKFEPAKLHGTPMPVTILFPVYFRHPEAPPPASDSLLKATTLPGDSAAPKDTTKTTSTKAAEPSSSKSSNSTKKKSTRHSTRRHRSD